MSVPPIKKNVASQTFPLNVFDSDNAIVTTPTIAAGDFVIYADFVSKGNLTVAEDPASSGLLKASPTQDQTNGDLLSVKVEDQAGSEWESHWVHIWTIPSGSQLTDLATSAALAVVDANIDTNGVVVNSLTTAAKALVQTEAEDALRTYDLDHLIETSAGSEEPTDGTYLDQIMHKASGQTFDATTDSLEAIRDTLSSSSITTVAAVSGDTVTVVPYTTWEFTIDGLSDLTGAKANGVFFTVMEKYTDADSAAILQVQEGVGLLYINGVAATAADGSLTVAAGEDEITVHVNADATAIAEKRNLVYDIKMIITDNDDADQMATGTFHIAHEAVTRDLAV